MQAFNMGESVSAVELNAELHRINQHIRSLASLHDLLTQEVRGEADIDSISLKSALEKLIPMVQMASGERQITTYAEDARLSLKKGSSFAMLVNELISNAIKHGQGEISVSLTREGEKLRLEVSDNGPGFPEGFDPRKAANTGLDLIESMGRYDLRGE